MFQSRAIAVSIFGAALSVSLSPPAAADATTTPTIIVTATRSPVDISRVAASTTVITRKDIEAMQVHSVPELLEGIAGLDVTQSGGPGKATSVFLRGTESDHVLVLVNGIRVGSVSLGTTAFEQMPVEAIDHIEIVRGPRAAEWGSDAIGGVIQIFTRSGAGLAPGQARYDVGAGLGSYHTSDTRASVAGATRNSSYEASVEYFDTAGFNARQPIPGPYGFNQPDRDGYRNLSFHVRGNHRFSDDLDLDAFLLHAQGTTEFDGLFQTSTDFIQQVAGAQAHWQASDHTSIIARAGESRDDQQSYAPDGSFSSRFNSTREDLSLLADIEPVAGQAVNLGIDYLNDRLDSNYDYAESSRDDTGVFAEYLGTFGEHNITASVRHDDNQATGGNTTGGLGWSVNLPSSLKLYASWGTAFRTPSFNELYYPGYGNPNLAPETSQSFEAGVEGRPLWGSWKLSAYRTDIKNLIATVLNPTTQIATPENVDQARIDGLEGEVRFVLAGYHVDAALTLMNPRDRTTGKLLPRRPKTALSIDVSRRLDRVTVGGRLIAQGDRYDDANNTVKVDSFATVDLTAQYELRRSLFLRARLGNLFNEDYQTVATYNTAGRNIFVSLLYKHRP